MIVDNEVGVSLPVAQFNICKGIMYYLLARLRHFFLHYGKGPDCLAKQYIRFRMN